jgi:Tol biopolymer transport system component
MLNRFANRTICRITTISLVLCLCLSISIVTSATDPSDLDNEIAFYSTRDGKWEIYTMNADGSDVRRLTHHISRDALPSWSPDGGSIAFQSRRDGNWNIYVLNVSEALACTPSDRDLALQLTDYRGADEFPSWSRDGTQIVYESEHGNEEIYIINADGSNPLPITQHSAADYAPAWRSQALPSDEDPEDV